MKTERIFIMSRDEAEEAIKDVSYTACISIHNPYGSGRYCNYYSEPSCPIWPNREIKFLPLDFEDDLLDPRMIDVEKAAAFAKTLSDDDKVIVHCLHGISRSSAIAIVISLTTNPCSDVRDIVHSFRQRYPHIRPNKAIISYADEYFSLDGALTSVVEDL